MGTKYTVWLSDRLGNRIIPIQDFVSAGGAALSYNRVVNEVTLLSLSLPVNDTYSSLFKDSQVWLDNRIEVWREVDNGSQYLDTETVWYIRRLKKNITQQTFALTAVSANEILKRRIIAYKAGTAQALKTDNIDDIMRAIIRENFGSSAIAARNISTYFTVTGDLAQGTSITKAFSYNNVLQTLQELSQQSITLGIPIYFDVVGIISASGVNVLEFRTYKNQRGTDRTFVNQNQSVILSPENETLTDVEISYDYVDEANYIYVGGSGTESDRAVVEVNDAVRIAASPINRREVFTQKSDSNNTNVLTSFGNSTLRNTRPRKVIEASIRDNTQYIYGRDYFFGDKITANVDSDRFDATLDVVSVSIAGGKEVINSRIRGEI